MIFERSKIYSLSLMYPICYLLQYGCKKSKNCWPFFCSSGPFFQTSCGLAIPSNTAFGSLKPHHAHAAQRLGRNEDREASFFLEASGLRGGHWFLFFFVGGFRIGGGLWFLCRLVPGFVCSQGGRRGSWQRGAVDDRNHA